MGQIIKPLGGIDKGSSKKDILDLAEAHANQIADQGYDLLKVFVELKRYQVYLGEINKHLQAKALDKAKQEGKKSFEYANAKVQVQNRTKYNYEKDEKWSEIDAEINELKKRRKERETLLKKVSKDYTEIVDEETGEIETLMAPIKEVLNQLVIRL